MAVLVAALALIAASSAGAAVTVGSSLSLSPTLRCTDNVCTVVQISGGSGTIQAPSAGVIVTFRIKHGPVPEGATVGFRILSGSGPSFTHALRTRQFPFAAENRSGGGITAVGELDANGRPRGVSIAAGERIAVVVQDAGPFPFGFIAEQTGGRAGFLGSDHLSGTASYEGYDGLEVLINGTLEADADRDGYGDETQDNCKTVANDQTTNPCLSPPPPPPPPPGPPALGRSFVVEPVTGQTFVKRGRGAFQLLARPRRLPMGSLVDTRGGTARVRSARNRRGNTQSGDFFGGLFQVLQSRNRRARGLTELRLKGSSFSNCEAEAASPGSRAFQSRRSRRVVRGLGGVATGRFRTRGRHSAATVRGTTWGTIDRCDGTLTWITRGSVAVREFRRRKTIVVRAGKPGPLGTTRLTRAPDAG